MLQWGEEQGQQAIVGLLSVNKMKALERVETRVRANDAIVRD